MKNRQRGFTLVELLVVSASIGLLSTIGVVSLNQARAKARDAKRLSDVRQLSSILELFYNGQQAYPFSPVAGTQMSLAGAPGISGVICDAGTIGVVAAAATTPTCASGATLLATIPIPNAGTGTQEYRYYGYLTSPAPAPPSSTAVGAQLCDGTAGKISCQAYGIQFTLETSISGINSGLNCFTASGILTQPATPVGCTHTG